MFLVERFLFSLKNLQVEVTELVDHITIRPVVIHSRPPGNTLVQLAGGLL
jgi:hypothetical protein